MQGARFRLVLVCFAFCGVFSIFSYRLVQLQVVDHEKYVELAAEKHTTKITIHAQRGMIMDARNEVLAANIPVRTVVADASLVTDTEAFAKEVGEALEMDAADIREKLATGRRYIVLKKKVPEELAGELGRRLRELNLRGLTFEQDAVRSYPNGNSLAHGVGYTNHDYAGMDGVERMMDRFLRGEDGYRRIEHDRTGKELVVFRGREQPAKNGLNVRLTVDMGLQHIVDQELDKAIAQYKPRSAVVILMRPKTGEILAIANRPDFDPNAVGDADENARRNRAVTDMVEPGSTFKVVTVGAVWDQKIVNSNTTVFCENGRYAYGNKILRDHHPYGMLTVHDVLMKSSNIGSAKLAMQLGEQRLYDYMRRFGFGESTGLGLPGEIGGMVHPPHKWSKISITRIPMGHEVCVTPIQLLTAHCAIANDGVLMRPQIVKAIVDERGKSVANFPPVEVRRVLSTEAAREVRIAMRDVVSEKGTARLAIVPGYAAAGKTGTAQRVDPNGGYTPGKYVISFVGFLPAERPELACLVMLDDAVTEPGLNYGGTVAAPIFASIAQRAVRYLDIEPTAEPVLPASRGAVASASED